VRTLTDTHNVRSMLRSRIRTHPNSRPYPLVTTMVEPCLSPPVISVGDSVPSFDSLRGGAVKRRCQAATAGSQHGLAGFRSASESVLRSPESVLVRSRVLEWMVVTVNPYVSSHPLTCRCCLVSLAPAT
jgi:hypothetical protein